MYVLYVRMYVCIYVLGFSIGIEFRDATLVLNNVNTTKFTAGYSQTHFSMYVCTVCMYVYICMFMYVCICM